MKATINQNGNKRNLRAANLLNHHKSHRHHKMESSVFTEGLKHFLSTSLMQIAQRSLYSANYRVIIRIVTILIIIEKKCNWLK